MPSQTVSRFHSILALAALTAAGSACNYQSPPPMPGDVLFQDDFSRPISGWDRYHDDVYSADYAEGGYRIQIFAPETDAWANPGLNLADVRIELDATKRGGPDDNTFGVLCRYQDPRNFYFFLLSSDGYTGIGINIEGTRFLLSGDTMFPSGAVLQGDVTNHIRVECVGCQRSPRRTDPIHPMGHGRRRSHRRELCRARCRNPVHRLHRAPALSRRRA